MSASSVNGSGSCVKAGCTADSTSIGENEDGDEDVEAAVVAVTVLAAVALAAIAACSERSNRDTGSNDTNGCGCTLL